MHSKEHEAYLRKIKYTNLAIIFMQITIAFSFVLIWELLVYYNVINPFLTSSPSRVVNTIINLSKNNNLLGHIFITVYETAISFTLATIIGISVAAVLWWNHFIARVLDPYLTILNSLPKVALGPILIIWAGANMKSIILMALLISVIITIINVYNGFLNTDNNKIKLLKSFGATKKQIFTKVIFPANFHVIINSLKINASMALIGVIMGELLVSKQGIGYLIMYGSQVFNLDLVITGIFILAIVSYLIYGLVSSIEKRLIKDN